MFIQKENYLFHDFFTVPNPKGEDAVEKWQCYIAEYTYAGEYPTAHKYSTIHGISQGEKYRDDFRPTCKFKIQIWLKKFLA